MRFRWIVIMYLKEMLDLLRDKKTIISMIIVPTLSIPVIVLGMKYFIQKSAKEIQEKKYTVALKEDKKLPHLVEVLKKNGFEVKISQKPKEDVEGKKAQAGVVVEASSYTEEQLTQADELIQKLIKDMQAKKSKEIPEDLKKIDLSKIKKAFPSLTNITVYCDLAKFEGKLVNKRISESLALLTFSETTTKLLGKYKVKLTDLNPFNVEMVNLAPPKKMAGMVLGQILGYLIIIMMLSGGMYAAIDITAGEKERRTMEMLLSAPTTREEVVMGKVIATITITFVTAMLTLISFGITFHYTKGDPEFKKVLGGISGLPVDMATIFMLLSSLLPLAVLCASLLILIATLAKSFKEAQSYLTPLIMVAIFPAMVSFIPGIKLDTATALMPIVNFSLFIKELLLGEWVWSGFWISLGANLVYASLAFYLCVRVFKNEKVLFRV